MRPYYEQDGITIYHGDCRGVLPTLAQVDHVITDPPYDPKTHKGARHGFMETSSQISFAPLDVMETVPLLLGVSHRWVVAFCSLEMFGAYRDAAGDRWVRAGFWRRTNGVPQFTGDRPGQPGEGIAIMHGAGVKRWNGHGHHAFWEHPIVSGGPHPTTKPEPLMAAIVSQFTDAGDLILDPFMGSGTTLVAAKRLGRKAIGIEIEEKYCEIAAKRLAQGALPMEFSA
jgi:hypothetical protein